VVFKFKQCFTGAAKTSAVLVRKNLRRMQVSRHQKAGQI